jgi:hypothetical protein
VPIIHEYGKIRGLEVAVTGHSLTGKLIIHYYCSTPWQSISDLDEHTANSIAAQSGKTFDGSYYRQRLAIEQRDRERYLSAGGLIENPNPVYAILCDAIPDPHPHHGEWIAIPADMVREALISLSIGDSFIACEPGPQIHGTSEWSWSPKALMDALGGKPLPTDWPPHINADGNPFYIEARLYTRALPSITPRPCLAARMLPQTPSPATGPEP